MNVQSILTAKGTDVTTVPPEASLAQAAAELRDRGVGALVVSSDGRTILGILSERDVVRAIAAHGASALGRTVASAMSANVVTCAAGDSIADHRRGHDVHPGGGRRRRDRRAARPRRLGPGAGRRAATTRRSRRA